MNSILLSRRHSLLGLAAGATLPAFPSARANEPCWQGPIILTVGGLIEQPNRQPFLANRDRFFDHNNLSFEKARAFTAGEIAALPREAVRADIYGTEASTRGPRLGDILAAARPSESAKTVRLSALDGYAAELSLADARSQQWILALEMDGQPLALGDFGPLYAMRQLPAGEKKTEEESDKWVHSLYYIELAP